MKKVYLLLIFILILFVVLTYRKIIDEEGVIPTVSPTPSSTAMPKPTATPTPKPTNTPESTPKPTNTPKPTATPKPTPVPYVITKDNKYSGYSNIAEYSSSTLKYRIISHKNQDIVLIWVANPLQQLNGALATSDALHSDSAENILSNEISSYGYQNKGMIAVNASFYSPTGNVNGTPRSGVVMNHGKLVKNTGTSGALIGLNRNSNLKEYVGVESSNIVNEGVRNTFVISSRTSIDSSTDQTNRTQICQYDENNFAILSGSGTVSGCGKILSDLVGCSIVYNLDGGGSRKLYYKNSSTTTMTKKFGGSRIIPDMLYFVEQ